MRYIFWYLHGLLSKSERVRRACVAQDNEHAAMRARLFADTIMRAQHRQEEERAHWAAQRWHWDHQ